MTVGDVLEMALIAGTEFCRQYVGLPVFACAIGLMTLSSDTQRLFALPQGEAHFPLSQGLGGGL